MRSSCLLCNSKPSVPAARRHTPTSPQQRASVPARLEALEDRRLFNALTVTNLQDSGAGSLRAEITAAQSGDTIIFSPTLLSSSTMFSPILLSSSTKLTSSSGKGHGKPTSPPPPPPPPVPTITLTSGELLLAKNLTIQGPGAGQLNIYTSSTNLNERVFEVATAATVTLSGLTISGTSNMWGGVASWDGYGGGILNHGALSVSGCNISGHIQGYDTEGGGIFNDGTLSLNACTVSQSWAEGTSTSGAGIGNWGTATLTNTVISKNMADPDASTSYPWFNQGGGIINSGTMTLNGCTISGNNSRTAGGGIFNTATLILNSSKVTGNTSEYGGGIYNTGTMTLQYASSISANGAAYGNDTDNVGGTLNVLDTSSAGILDSVPAFLSFE